MCHNHGSYANDSSVCPCMMTSQHPVRVKDIIQWVWDARCFMGYNSIKTDVLLQTLPSTHVCAWHNNCACCVYDLIHRKYTHITDAFSLMTSSCSVFSWGDSLNEIILLRLEDDIISWATADDCTAETRTHTHTSSCLRHNLQKDPKPSFVNKWRFL